MKDIIVGVISYRCDLNGGFKALGAGCDPVFLLILAVLIDKAQ